MRKGPRILAVSSGGGHWIELLRLRPAFEGGRVSYATVQREYRSDVTGAPFFVVARRHKVEPGALFGLVLRTFLVLARVRPEVIITTGAAPGYVAIRLGRLLGAKTIWVDSIANVDELSLSGRLAGRHVTCG